MDAYNQELVNTFTNSNQDTPAIAVLADGSYVVVWTSYTQDGVNSYGVYAQRFTASGVPTSPEFRINTTTGNNQSDSSVAALSDGGFVFTWTDNAKDGSGDGIYAQRFDATGEFQGGEFRVNTTTSSTQYESSVAAYTGGFVVTWTSYNNPGDASSYGVYAQRYNNDGTLSGGEFRVNTTTSGHQYESDVAANADGSFVVVWRSDGQDGSSAGVYAQRYDNTGSPADIEFKVNTYTTGAQYEPKVATLVGGGFVVVWRSDSQDGSSAGVYAQRYDASGVAQGSEFRVNESTAGGQYQPDVVGLANGGFTVTWFNDNYDVSGTGSYYDAYVREYNATGATVTGQVKVNTPDNNYQSQPAIAHLGSDNYVVVWTDNVKDGSGNGIFQQLFGTASELPRQANPELGDFADTVTFGENLVNTTPQVLDHVVSLTDIDSANFNGGRVELFYTQYGSAEEDQLGVRNQGIGVAQIGVSGNTVSYNDGAGSVAIGTLSGGTNGADLTVSLNANATVDAVEALIQNLTYANTSNSPQASRMVGLRVYDGDGGTSNAGTVTINVTREEDGTPMAYGEEQVNTYTGSTQEWPAIATLNDGSYVVAWSSSLQDGDNWGIYAQRYANNGEAMGPELRVNTLTNGQQDWPQITALSDGGYVIVWQDAAGNDGSGWGVYGQRYDASSVAQGGQFLVNTTTSSTQYHDNVAAYTGGFAVVWSNGSDIYLQRFDNAGTKQGSETLVSTAVGSSSAQSGAQYVPDIAAYANGDLVIVWSDYGSNDGSANGVYGRLYNAVAGTFGDTFLVNTTTAGQQSYYAYGEYAPNVAVLANGDFVVVWPSDNNDASGWAVMGQRFNASGVKLGGEFQVNETIAGGQYMPDVTALSTGGFVVTFYNDNYDIDGTGTTQDVYIREYDNAGNAIDGQRKLVSNSNSTEYHPAIADLGSGNFAVVYADYNPSANGGNNTYEIMQQLFGDTAELARSVAPQLVDFIGTVTFAENTVNAGMQVIDAAVGLSDPDSGNFNGGRLDLYYIQNGATEDQLGVVHQGNSAGQIGVSGNTVSYGGAVIGTISGGSNGANLRIDFTSTAATVDAVEALIQRLGYQNSDSSPNASRTLGLRVSDGDGGTSQPNVLTINLTQSLDGTPAAYGEEQVNTFTGSNQQWPAVATLNDGSYVVSWDSYTQDESNSWGIYAQRYANNGEAMGPEVQVNTLTNGEQSWSQIAALSNGGYVIVWQDAAGNDGSGWGVFGQSYDSSGAAQGSQFLVNTTISGTQYHDNVAAYTGGFAAVWSNGSDIYLKRYDNAGNLVTDETRVSTTPGNPAQAQSGAQYVPDIAAYANGNLVIVWNDAGNNDGGTNGVYGRLYNASAGTFGDTFLVNTTTAGNQSYYGTGEYVPNVAVLANGDFVVVWPSDNNDASGWAVMGQHFNASGVKLGGEFQVNETIAGSQYTPDVTALSTGGFVVTFYNDNYDVDGTGSTADVYIREYDNAGNAIDGQRKVNTLTASTQSDPAIADLGSGNFAVVWSSYISTTDGGNNTYEIRQQLFGDTAELARSASPQLVDFIGTATFAENTVNAGMQVIDAAVGLSDPDSGNFNGGRLDLYYIQDGATEDQLGVVHQGIGAGQIGMSGGTVSYGGTAIGTISGGTNGADLRVDFTSNDATVDAVEALIQRLGYQNSDSSPNASRTLGLRVSDGDGGASQPNVLTINITSELDGAPAVYGEEQVNTHTTNYQYATAVAELSGGGYVAAWVSRSQDGTSNQDGIYAQRFLGNGEAVGPEFRVNTSIAGNQQEPKLAGLSNGDFVVLWSDDSGLDSSGWGVYGQRFDASGAAQGSQFLVNATSTSSTQNQPSVASYTGGFVATWSSTASLALGGDGSSYGVYAQRFNNDGSVNGASFRVNTTTANAQYESDVAANADGSFVVAWRSDSQDGSGAGVYFQRYDAVGAAQGSETLANTITSSSQYEAKVATLSGGGFVIVWRDDGGQDGSANAVFGQRFDASGVKLGGQFLVNETTAGSQYQPDVVGLANGGFVVTFYNDNYDIGDTSTSADVYIREYDAAGNAVDGQRKVNTFPSNSQYEPAIAHLGSDNFVVLWRADGSQDGSLSGVYQQLFGSAAELARASANPVLDDLRNTHNLSYTLASPFYAGNPLVIDPDVYVTDSDSANFDGGSLLVEFLDSLSTGTRINESVAIRNQGSGTGQIGISGSNVTYGGTTIGSFSGGAAGANLAVSLNSSATAAAVQALVQNITYVNSAPGAAQTDRYLGFRLFDGDGGASLSSDMLVRIQATVTPAAVDLQDVETAVTLSETQAQAGVVLDPGVQLVYNGAGSFNNGSLTVSYVSSSSRVEDKLSIRNEGAGTGQVSVSGSNVSYEGVLIGTINAADTGANGDQLVINFNASATDQAIERVIENLSYQTTSDGPNESRTISIVVRDSANTASTAGQMVINITPAVDGASKLFGEQQVNTYESNEQHVPVVAGLQGVNDGGYVVVWRSYLQDGDTYGIYGQRYDAKGAAVGAEFQVNSQTLGAQQEPEVASLANGGFVAVWTDQSGQDGSSYGVYAQVYGANGAPVGGEFRVNTTTLSTQYQPAVVGLTDGSFVVAYRSDYTGTTYTPDEILAKRYSETGTLLVDEFTINTTTAGTQFEPHLAALSGDKFVAVWSDTSNDGSGYGVFSKVFNANGTVAVAEQVVNTTISGNQYGSDVAALAGGGYVAVWWSADNQIHGQRFDAAGAKTGGEFQVSTVDTAPNNNWSRITALDSGGFVVAWDANGYEVYIQQYDAAGNKIDGATRVNSTTASVQYYPDIAGLTGSNFVVAWAGHNQEANTANTYGIFTQIMGAPGSITRSAAPELADVASSVSFAENLVNAAPQLIDGSVKLSDIDSANFNGGQLVAAIIPDGQNQAIYQLAQDQLGIRNEGNTAGQVGVSGNNISYGGTVIGTLVSNGANGSDLVVNLSANATAQAVEAVIENLTYANNSTDPAASRLVSIRVNDGAGGASEPRTVQIGVTPEVDGASKLFGEQQVNTYESNEQHVPVVAGLQGVNDGGYVVVWRSYLQDGDTYGIYGQRYDAKGAAVGAEFQVNSQTLGAQQEPEVASLANGGFVAVWTDQSGQDGSSYGVYAQVYGANGAPVGGEFRVNTTTLSTQYQPAVVGLTDGSFVVAYRSDYTGTTYTPDEILAKRYSETGTLLVDEFTINTTTAGTQFEPHLAALSGDKFVAVWSDTSNDGSGYGVFSKVFNANGTVAVAEQVVNTTISGNQYGSDVAALAGGGYVAVWWSADNQIHGQRFDAAGAKTGGEFQVSTVDTAPNNNWSRITALDSGGFVVAWDANGYEVYIQQYDAAGNKIDGATRVNSTTASVQYYPDIADLTGSNFVVAWAGHNQEANTANTYGIFTQIMGAPGSITRSAAPELADVASSVSFAENLVNAAPQLIDGSVKLSDIDSANFNGGQLVVSVLSGYGNIQQAQLPQNPEAQDQFAIRNQGTSAGQVGVSGSAVSYGGTTIGSFTGGSNGNDLVVTFNTNATAQAVEAVIENLTYANSASNPVASRTVSIQVSDGAGGASVPQVMQINVTPEYDGSQPLFQEEVVNTYTPNTQSEPAMARLADGGYVTVWTSAAQDGWDNGVYGQRYDAQGVAAGNQFQVNDYTPYDQYEPAIAGLNGGGFVVVWRSQNQDGSGAGVYAQRYDANSIQIGDAFLVNSHVTNNQYQPSVASIPGGGFVAAWYSDSQQDGRYYDVFFQRFDNNGVAQGAETRANTSTGFENSAQYEPAIAVLNDGSFMVAWRSDSQDGSSAGVYGQRFASNGTALGSEFRINTYSDSTQFEPSIAALTGGGFVVSWTSTGQDGGGSYGVFAQRYANDGTPLGSEFRINTTTASSEQQPSISALGNGGFVVAWTNGSQICAQQYNAGGVAVDGETRVDVKDNNWASQPVVQGLSNGNFVVSWYDYQDDASANTYGVFQRLFGNPANFSQQANPELVDVAQSVTFLENDVNLMPQVIDPGVGLFDADSANFAGGRLEVDYISGYGGQDQLGFEGLENQDQLGIRNEGNAPTQVGVSGLNVLYSGVQIGSIIANGANHGKLMVEFNASATVEAVESVIENLTYQNLASNPFASRTVSLRVTDGDGGSSDARFITLNVTPEVDGAVPRGLEKQVNTTVANTQEQPSVAHLADGGYVAVWQSYNQDSANTWGVYGQRYDANDNAVGSEFRVNTTTTNSQYEPQVTGLTGGGFVTVWRSDSQDGSGAGVYAQRYDANGNTAGSEFMVNTTTSSNQYQPDITSTLDGGFVVAWYHDSIKNGEYYDVYFQRYNASGIAQGGETKANTPIGGNTSAVQSQPSIAWLAGGGFVAAWTDNTQDGNGYGVYGRRFDASGNALGSEFRANTYTDSHQYEPSVAALKDGGYIMAWRSDGQDLSGAGVYAQRYDASGNTVGTEFRVNTTTGSTQYDPSVTGLENGGWVVTWNDQYGAAPNTYDVFMQQYDAAGRQLDGQTLVNTYTYYVQEQPSITSMADGGFVVAYSSYIASTDQNGDGIPDGGNNTQEIRLQRFSNTAPALTDVFVSGQEDSAVVLTDELFISGFNDPEGQNLTAIKVTTLPAQGALKLDGVAVIPGQEISLADLQANKLVYQGNLNYFGLDQFAWTGSDGIAFAPTPVYTNINLSNVNDAPALQAGADDTAAEGTFFSHAIILGDPDPDTHQVTVAWGDGTANTVYNTSADLLNISHYFPDNGSYTVTVTANDQQGQANSVEVDSFQVAVSNVAPDLNLFGDATVEQNLVYTLTLGGVYDPGTDTVSEYRIDWGDGTAVQNILSGDLPGNRQVTHSYAATGPKTIAVSLVDEDGTFNNVETKAITVSAPAEVLTVNTGPDLTMNEGQFFVPNITFNDPTDTDPAGRLYNIDWGDGTTSSGRTFNANSLGIGHTYADGSNAYTVNVTVDDDSAQSGSDSFQVTVDNVAPTLTLSGNSTVSEGSVYTLNISKSDPGTDTIASYSVDWGDGSAPVVLTAAALALQSGNVQHTYADGTTGRTITVQATDEDGVWSQTKDISVNNVAPTIALSGNLTVDEGAVYTLTLGAVTDPGQDTPTSYTINWGDGIAEVVTSLGNHTHVYADGTVNHTISVLVTDEDGAHANAGTMSVTVNNVAPSVALSGAASIDEGAPYTLNVGAVTDPGADSVSLYTINWGDGSAAQVLTAAQLNALGRNVAHTYADGAATPTITVDMVDEDGAYLAAGSKAIVVNNVAPTIALSGADSVNEGSVYTLGLAALVDPGVETQTGYSIDWGDGTVQSFTPAEYAALAGSAQHTYADGGASGTSRTIQVSVADEDGTFVAGSKPISVNNVAPAAVLGGANSLNEGGTYTLNIVGSDPAGANDTLSYNIEWGDGSAVQSLTAAQLAALSGNVTHVFADDQDGPINATARTIQVTVSDEDGGSSTSNKAVTVNNVAPLIALAGAANVVEDTAYTLTLGTPSDPGTDTVTSYVVNWGDGTSNSYATAGDVTHTYADPANRTITVDLVDEDGTHTAAGSKAVTVDTASATLSVNAGADTSLNEGDTFTRTIAFSDGQDNGAAGWSYTIDYGDGTLTNSGTTLTKSLDLDHQYADGDANHTVTVTLTDEVGETASDNFQVTVNNVAPAAPVTGADTVDEGSPYTLTVGAVADPGADTRTGYSINWGDGSTNSFTPVEWTAAAGSFSHSYADGGAGGTARTVMVSTSDEDGAFTLGSKNLTVNNIAPALAIGGAANTNEGASYALTISATDSAGANDPLGYSIDWGDGSVVQTLTAAQLAALSGNVSHVFADDQDGPVNATSRTISVTADDSDGGSTTESNSITVNNVAPTAPVSGADTVAEGSAYALNVGAVTDPGADVRSGYSIDWGDGSTGSFTPTEWANAAGSFSHTYADGGAGGTARTITVSATDEDGSFTLGSKSLTVDNVAPNAVLAGTDSLNEGGTYTLNIIGSDAAGANDTLSYSIDWGDGSAAQTLNAAQLATLSGNVTHLFADDQDGPVNATPRTIQVTVSDEDGGSSSTSRSVTVNNVAPTIALGGAANVLEDTAYTLTLGAPSDPGTDTVTSYMVNWGDGTSNSYATAGDVTHTYADPGNYGISVDLVDEDGTHTNAGGKNVAIDAASATLSVNAGADVSVNEGDTYSRSITFSDGQDDGAQGWVYSINYGDGSAVVNGATLVNSLNLSHQYIDGDANHTVTVTLEDVPVNLNLLGETASDSFQVTVNNVAPTAPVSGADTVDEGSVYTLAVGAATDPGADTRTGYSIAWGDGSSDNLTPAQWATAAGSFSHTYADGGAARTIIVSTTDEDGSFTLGSKSLTVNNVAPTIALGGATSTDEGSAYTLTLGAVTDPGADTVSQYLVHWGDGTSDAYNSAGNVTHTYADGSTAPTITVDLVDEDGTYLAAGSKAITVNNVAPTAAVTGADTVNEGSAYSLSVGAVVDPGADIRTGYSIAWGDGSTDNLTPVQWAAAADSFAHTYADGGAARTITLSATDEDGSFTLGSKSLTVNNVAPTVALGGAGSTDEGSVYTLTLGAVADPGTDTVTGYVVNWGDGSSNTYASVGDVTHVYADVAGDISRTISVDLVDEDGIHSGAGSKGITVNDVTAPTIIHLGDASGLVTTLNPYVWAPFWTDASVDISHKADYNNAGEAWTPVNLSALNSATLSGGDLYGGDLGVSGKNLATSTINQELQGAETLRFDLDNAATRVTVDLTKFFLDDDANVFNYNEAGYLLALDSQGNAVAGIAFVADSTSGTKSVSLDYGAGFNSVVLAAGAFNGSTFVFGAYANDAGAYAAAPYNDGKLHGSDFLLDSIEFELALIGVNPNPVP